MKDHLISILTRSAIGSSLVLLVMLPALSLAAEIHDIARSGDLAELQRATLNGAGVNDRSNRGETPLMIASMAGHGEIVSYLLQRGAHIDARNDRGLSALHAAAYSGQADIARLLIDRGARIDDEKNDFGVTPLHLAAEENQIEVVYVLLELGADTGILETNGYSPLSRAGWREHWDVVNALLAVGATCQPEDKVGEWLYTECSTRADSQ